MSPRDDTRRALIAAADDACARFGRRPVGAFMDPCAANLTVKIVRLTFVSDHGLLTDYDPQYPDLDRWQTGGTRYEQRSSHEWAKDHNFPISHTKNTKLAVIPEFEITPPPARALQAEVQGRATPEFLGLGPVPEWAFEGTIPFRAGASMHVILSARAPLPDEITQHLRSLTWQVTIGGTTYVAGTTGPHQVYATYGTPLPGGQPQPTPYGDDPPVDEEGITEHRMRAAVVLAKERLQRLPSATRNDPQSIVKALMALVPGYELKRSPLVPKDFDHPRYYPELQRPPAPKRGGAWPIAEYLSERAECQAICRFVRGILLQLGCPGTADVVAIYAREDVDSGKKALEDSLIPEDTHSDRYVALDNGTHVLKPGLTRQDRKKKRWQLLADDEVKIGQVVPYGDIFNSYEACLKFTFGGVTRYYGGGMPGDVFDTAQEVLKTAFWGLVEVAVLHDGSKQVERIVAKKDDW